MKRVNLLISIGLVLAAATACRLVAPTPDPAEIRRLVAEAVQATIEAMPTATPYPTYTPGPLAATYTPPSSVYTPLPVHTVAVAPMTPGSQPGVALRTHIVVAGDTLSGLAKEYGSSVEAIVEANALRDAGLIIIGQVLSIPVGEAGATSAPSTSPTPIATTAPAISTTLAATAIVTPTTPTSLTPIATVVPPDATPTETPTS